MYERKRDGKMVKNTSNDTFKSSTIHIIFILHMCGAISVGGLLIGMIFFFFGKKWGRVGVVNWFLIDFAVLLWSKTINMKINGLESQWIKWRNNLFCRPGNNLQFTLLSPSLLRHWDNIMQIDLRFHSGTCVFKLIEAWETQSVKWSLLVGLGAKINWVWLNASLILVEGHYFSHHVTYKLSLILKLPHCIS